MSSFAMPGPVLPGLVLPALLLLASAGVIYLACEYFVNGVEWLGRGLNVGSKATGTVLAAFGTALPESVVTFVAVAVGASAASKALGIGAALGGPLALATIAYATVGGVLLATRRRLPADAATRAEFARLGQDQLWFLAIFVVKIVLGVVMFAGKPWLGVAFLAAYALYVRHEMAAPATLEDEDLEPLRLAPRTERPALGLVIAQTLGALVVIFIASRLFVSELERIGPALGLPPQLLALFLSPLATELPETLNAVIWVRQGKYGLALANISGAMMIQATVPTALGLFFTPWLLDAPLLIAAGATGLAVAAMAVAFRCGRISRRFLAAMALVYAGFVATIVALGFAG